MLKKITLIIQRKKNRFLTQDFIDNELNLTKIESLSFIALQTKNGLVKNYYYYYFF